MSSHCTSSDQGESVSLSPGATPKSNSLNSVFNICEEQLQLYVPSKSSSASRRKTIFIAGMGNVPMAPTTAPPRAPSAERSARRSLKARSIPLEAQVSAYFF
jgi:hypothetical protein